MRQPVWLCPGCGANGSSATITSATLYGRPPWNVRTFALNLRRLTARPYTERVLQRVAQHRQWPKGWLVVGVFGILIMILGGVAYVTRDYHEAADLLLGASGLLLAALLWFAILQP